MRRSRLAAAVAVAVVAVVAAAAAPADAHTVTGVQPTNYRSEILGITPADPAVKLEILDLGNRVRLTNTGPTDLVVLGYGGEPYLKVGPAGVYENRLSPSVELNKAGATATTATTATTAGTAPPQPGGAPSWRKTSNGRTVTWRDRRTRWEGGRPAAVRADPSQARTVGQWTIETRRGDVPVDITGRIVWEPPPDAAPWIVGAVVIALAVGSLGLLRRWGRALSATVAVLVATDVVHTVGNSRTGAGGLGAVAARVLVGGLLTTVAWATGVWAVAALQRQREEGLVAAGFAAAVVFLASGLGDVPSLERSQLAYAWAPVSARALVTLALGVGFGTAAAAVIVLKRAPPTGRRRSGPDR